MHPGLLSPRRDRPRFRGAALLLTVLVVLSAATITAVLVQVAVQAAGGQKRRLAHEVALEQAHTIERRVANVLSQDPLRVFDEVLPDEAPRVCVADQESYPSALSAGSQWPASCGTGWSYEGTGNLAKGARVFPPSPSSAAWRVEVFAGVGSERVGFTRTFLIGGRDRPMLYGGGPLDTSVFSGEVTVNGPVYAAGTADLGSATLADGLLVIAESSVSGAPDALVAAPGAAIAPRRVVAATLPSSTLVSSSSELNRIGCRGGAASLLVLDGEARSSSLCLTAGASLTTASGAAAVFPTAGTYAAVLVVPESPAGVRVFTRPDTPAAWPGPLGEWAELGVFALPAHGVVVTDAVTVLGHCDEFAGACRDWNGDSLPGVALDESFTLVVGSASSPQDLYVGGPVRAASGRVGALVSGVVRFPVEAAPVGVPLAVDLWLAVLGRPGQLSVASSGTGSRPSLDFEGAVLLADFSVDFGAFATVSVTVPAGSSVAPPFFPSPGLLAFDDYARRLSAADVDALFVLGAASDLTVPSAPGLLSAAAGNASVTLTWAAPTSDGGATLNDYVVEYREASASTWETFSDGVSTELTASVTGIENDRSYQFRVAALNGVGTGPFSSLLTATPFVVPLAPSGLQIAAVDGSETSLALSWDPVLNVAPLGYNVYRQNLLSGVFEVVASPTTAAAVDTGLLPGTSYSYKVAAFTARGQGPQSSVVSASTPAFAPVAPSITATSRGNLTVTLEFTSSSSVERPVGGFRFYVDGTLVSSSEDQTLTSFTFTGLTAGVSAAFGVAATNDAGVSTLASETVVVIATPNAPTKTAVAPETDVPASLVLSWDAPTNVLPEGFYVYRLNESSGLYEVVATVTDTVFVDDMLAVGVLQSYRVAAFVADLEGGLSGVASAIPIDVPLDALVLTASLADLSVTLGFLVDEEPGRPVDGYRLLLDGVEVADITSPADEYVFSDLIDGFTYEFSVLGYNAAGAGLPDALLVTARAVPPQVTGLVVTPTSGSSTSLDLVWDEPVGSFSGFYVERFNEFSGVYEVVATVTVASHVDLGLDESTFYTYRVAAFSDAGTGPVSASVSAST